jgi:hypothetical protein
MLHAHKEDLHYSSFPRKRESSYLKNSREARRDSGIVRFADSSYYWIHACAG